MLYCLASPGRWAFLSLGIHSGANAGFNLWLAPTAAHAQTQDLFVASFGSIGGTGAFAVSRFAGTGPGMIATTATSLTDPSLNAPTGLAFDASGDFFVANSGTNTITKFTAGTTPGTFGTVTTPTDPSLNRPFGLVFDARGDLFAANRANNTITEFTAGATPGTFSATTTLTDPSLNLPEGLAVDAQGDLFAANDSSGTITKFTSTGLGTFGAVTTLSGNGLNDPTELAFNALGDLFVTNFNGGTSNSGTITKLAAGITPGSLGPSAVVETGLTAPEFLAFGPSAPVPEASTTVSLGLLLTLGMGELVVAAKKKRKA